MPIIQTRKNMKLFIITIILILSLFSNTNKQKDLNLDIIKEDVISIYVKENYKIKIYTELIDIYEDCNMKFYLMIDIKFKGK
jgi:hypothetical protein